MSGPVIVAARLGPGHDGRAEVVVELRYANGAHRSVSLDEEALGAAVDAAGARHLDDLVGQPWTVLLGRDRPEGPPCST